MNGTELKKFLMNGDPVSCNGVEYSKINAIIYRCSDGAIKVTAELLDRGGNSVVIVPSERVEEAKK